MSDERTSRPSPPPRGRSVIGGRHSRHVAKAWASQFLRALRAVEHNSRYGRRYA